jgi:hypothetical protein
VQNKSTLQRLVERFRETRSIGEKRRSGRPSVLSNDSLEDIRAHLLQSPRKSLRKLSQQTGMTYGAVQRATKVSNCIHTDFKSVMLKQFFDDRIISKNLWPLQCPNVTPPDYFLWGYLKQVVYSNRPQTIEDLKQNSEVAISNISQETLKKVVRNMMTRVNT